MAKHTDNFVTVFRTKQLPYLEGACEVLQEAGIPSEQWEENDCGSWPVSTDGGTSVGTQSWSLRVPKQFEGQAKQLLSSLPFPGAFL